MTTPASAPGTPAGKPKPARGHGGTLALAMLLAWIAIVAAAYVGWRQWQQAQGAAHITELTQRVARLDAATAAADAERARVEQRLTQLEQADQATNGQVPGLLARTRHLEDAVATLAERSRSGRDPILLDETESLLRMGAERYRLFHDADGARAAYDLADQTLAAVDDGAFSAVRQAIRSERAALAKSAAGDRAGALDRLQQLRGELASLPLRPLVDATAGSSGTGLWVRLGHALGRVIRVQRDDGSPLTLGDARFTRELAALDLAQAQAALLAYDDAGYRAALARSAAGIHAGFDQTAAAVQQALTTLRQLAAAVPTGKPAHLGAALAELRRVRAVHALAPAAGGSVPAPATPSPVRGAAHSGGGSSARGAGEP